MDAETVATTSAARQHELSALALLLEPRIAEGARALQAASAALQGSTAPQATDRHRHAVEYLTAQQSLRTRLLGLFVDAQTRPVAPDEFRAAMGDRG